MTGHWMLYLLAVGALVALGALAMERAMRAFRLPQRWVWAAAMVLTLAIPAAARWLPRAAEPAPAAGAGEAEGRRIGSTTVPGSAAGRLARIDAAALERPLSAGWMGTSAAAVLALLGAAAVLERRRRRWTAAEVEGVPVLLSPETGPAVIGLFRSRIVLPAWVLEADAETRALLLEHEREHLRAGDPRLLALGLMVIVLAPWNPAAWYQLRRLRLAIEIDCDARVLARRADVRAYGALLLEVGRRGVGGRLLAAAFSEPTSFLERRIRIMTSPRARFPWLRAGVFGGVAAALVAAACEAPGPVQTARTRAPSGAASEPGMTVDARGSGVRISRADVVAAVRTHYPEIFRAAATDTADLRFVLSPTGEIRAHERLRMRVINPDSANPIRWSEVRTPADPRHSLTDFIHFSPGQMGPGQVEVQWIRELAPGQIARTTTVDTVVVPKAFFDSLASDQP